MPHTAVFGSVLQSSLLWSLASVVSHYSLERAMDPVNNFQEAYKANRSEAVLKDVDDHMHAVGAIPANMTVTNFTLTVDTSSKASEPASFLSDELPKAIVIIIVMATLRYYWLIWLERLLPARSRGPTGPAPVRPSEKEDDDAREEEIIRKWMESGKIRRASLSWWNTFLKWMLDMTAGKLWQTFLEMVLADLMELKWPWERLDKWELLAHTVIRCFGLAPLVTLVGFILIPAHKRIVFEGAVDLTWNIFFGAGVNVVVPWALKTEFWQTVLRDFTEMNLPENETSVLAQRLDELGVDEL